MAPIALSIPSTASPEQALVIGETDCRSGGAGGQDGNNGWFSQRIADAAAKLKPDLIVHAGDFTYRDNNSRRLRGMPWQR
jgi:phosphodiesterase/alkaline phosphatase D-like protein